MSHTPTEPADSPEAAPGGRPEDTPRPADGERRGRRHPFISPAALALVSGLVAGGLGGYAASRVEASRSGSCDTIALVERAQPAVVTVLAQGEAGASGTGSGALISADGAIVTNDHVIAPAGNTGRIRVLLASGETKDASLVGTDPTTDLAVLRIPAEGAPTLAVGDDAGPRVGQQVVALGAPLGLSGTVTAGIVSALGRDIAAPASTGGTTVLVGSIQTDAAINPGNSGGPLVDCSGRMVGVNTAISTVPDSSGVAGGGNVGIGFAVPATTVRRITGELLRTGRATHPTLGMSMAEIPGDVASESGVPAGLYVQAIVPDGPADLAGVRVGDIIVSLAGGPATSMSVGQLLGRAQVGEKVELVAWRAGRKTTVELVLTERP